MEEKSGKFNLDSLDLDAPRSNEVLVKITATGICHTDLHARDGYFAMPFPAVYGHEGAGVVAAVGGAVEHLAAGDHVVISFPWCGECEHCREDRRSYCQRGRELKSGGVRADGSVTMRRNGAPVYGSFFQQSSFASHALAPARNAVKVRRDARLEFLGPLGCGLQTGAGAVINVMKPKAEKSFAVFGTGSVGLAGLMAAKLAGCDPIIAIDIRANRLELARSLGATHTIDNAREDAVTKIRKITGGGAHFTLETSGVSPSGRLPFDARDLCSCGQRPPRHGSVVRNEHIAGGPHRARRHPGRQPARPIHPTSGRSVCRWQIPDRSPRHLLRLHRDQSGGSGCGQRHNDQTGAANAAITAGLVLTGEGRLAKDRERARRLEVATRCLGSHVANLSP
jgi:aryl-alcohol dehydrogenase